MSFSENLMFTSAEDNNGLGVFLIDFISKISIGVVCLSVQSVDNKFCSIVLL